MIFRKKMSEMAQAIMKFSLYTYVEKKTHH